jgi:hypothetical protein
MQRDIFFFCAGAVVTGLGIIFQQETAFAKVLIAIGAIGMVASICHAFLSHKKKKLPELRCSFNPKDIGGCVCPNIILKRTDRITGMRPSMASSAPTYFMGGTPFVFEGTMVPTTAITQPTVEIANADRGTYYRVKVSAENGNALSCKGKLFSLVKGKKLIAEQLLLPFAPAGNPDALEKTIHEGSPEHLDFLFISDTNRVELTLPGFVGPSGVEWQSLFDTPGDYSFDFQVLSPTTKGKTTVLFHWTGNRSTSHLVGMN